MPEPGPAQPELGHYPADFTGRYYLQIPQTPPHLLFLALHGYGMNGATMLDLTRLLLGPDRLIASIQAPFGFYLKLEGSQVGYHWGTRDQGDACIALHHRILRQVRRELGQRFSIRANRTVLLGFSQPVGYNYRFAATWPDEVGGVIGLCGGVPKDYDTGNYGKVTAPLLHIARDQDEFFPPEVTLTYERKLRTRAEDVEFHLLAGAHRFPSKASTIVEPWLRRLFRPDGAEMPGATL